MNLLLIDDEVAAVNLLRDTVDWKSLGADQVFCAYNAAFARQILVRNQIDICVCDIEMPKENGLKLIKWIQEYDARIINIILTAHADFGYAQSAVSLNVFRFIVKPLVMGELKAVLREAADKMQEDSLREKQRKYGEYLVSHTHSGVNIEAWLQDTVKKINGSIPHKGENLTMVEKVEKYIEAHYSEPIRRVDIESQVHLNQDYISRAFKEATGYSLTDYIQYFRISVAKQLLLETDAAVGQVAAQVGYDSSAYFAKMFKKWTNQTPLEYRTAGRKNLRRSDSL